MSATKLTQYQKLDDAFQAVRYVNRNGISLTSGSSLTEYSLQQVVLPIEVGIDPSCGGARLAVSHSADFVEV